MSITARENFALRATEHWQPPPFRAPRTRRDRIAAALRRTLDLQATSAWRDLRVLLADAHGDVLDVGSGAQEGFSYAMPETEYFSGDRWPVADASVDVVLATETLEHVPEPAVFLAEARRVLCEGGGIVLTVPFSARWHTSRTTTGATRRRA